jgi:phosphoribosylaminoimidazolecarboxamide formyltransferase / IMP cyclohydrolase
VQNHKDVLVVVDSEDYPALLEFLKGNQDEQFRLKLAWKAFQHVASYDSAVSEWLWKQSAGGTVHVCVNCVVNYYTRNSY